MYCIDENIGNVAVNGGVLTILSNSREYHEIAVPAPNFGGEKHADSIVENDDMFLDPFNNEYRVSVYSSMNDISYTVECEHIEDDKEYREFCSNMTVYYTENPDTQYKNKESEDFDHQDNDLIATVDNIFSIKLSKQEGISELITFFENKNTKDIFKIDGLTLLKDKIKVGSVVFLVAGGDKGKIKFNYEQGLYGIAKVVDEPYQISGKSYSINVLFIYIYDNVMTQDALYSYENTKNIPNIGATTKGQQTQAISKLNSQQFKDILDATTEITGVHKRDIFQLFPWLKDSFKGIATENYKSLIDTMPPALNVRTIAKVFSNYLVHYNTKHTSTLIGIFGKWGRGKTYFYEQVQSSIEETENKDKTFYFCKFQPWKYQKQESAWAYLYESILKGYLEKHSDSYFSKLKAILKLNIRRLGKWALFKGFGAILLSAIWIFLPLDWKLSSAGWIIGFLGWGGLLVSYKTYSFISKNKHTALDLIQSYGKTKNYADYLGFQNEIEQELKYILEEYIDEKKERLILFVDDLDRCDEKMIINIIDGLRLVLDKESINSRLTIIAAIDQEILTKAIQYKYNHNTTGRQVNSQEYIEKFFLMGIKLSHLNEDDISELVEKYSEQLNNGMPGDSRQKLHSVLKEEIKERRSIFNTNTFEDDPREKNLEDIGKVEKRANDIKDALLESGLKGKLQIQREDSNEVGSQSITVELDNGEKKSILIAPYDLNTIVLNDNEILSIKQILITIDHLTPRKINILLHRYLLFKSLIFTVMSADKYNSFNEKNLIRLLFASQKEAELKVFIEHYQKHRSPIIQNILSSSESETINREDYITLVKFAEMVSPF